MLGLTAAQLAQVAEWEKDMWNGIHGYIGIHGETNDSEYKDVPEEKQRLLAEAFQPMAHRVDNEIKGIPIHYPTAATAQKANMSTDAFEDFFFDVCSFDYRKMAKASTPL